MVATLMAVAFVAGTVFGQQTADTRPGNRAELLTTIDLGSEIEDMQGYELRVVRVTRDPDAVGSVGVMHSHKGNPIVAYVLQGTFTDHREGGKVTGYKAGESVSFGKDLHWEENKGTTPLVFLAAAIRKRPAQ